jgi:hypothetical protein
MTATQTAAKKPAAAQISRVLNKAGLTKRASGKNSGYVVTTEKDSGKVINHVTGLPTSFRFPIVSIKWEDATVYEMFRSLVDPKDDLEKAEKALTDAGYHIVRVPVRGLPTLIAVPQELLDWRAERDERAAKADELAEAMVPACDRVIGYQASFPSHERRHGSVTRANVVAQIAGFLRNPGVDVLDREQIAKEARWHDGITPDSIACGFRMGGTVVLVQPV